MKEHSGRPGTVLRYDVTETPPMALSAALGLQVVVLIVAGIVLTPVIVLRAAGNADEAIGWVVFAALIVSGLTTILQARPLGRFGAGYVLFMGTSAAFIAVSVDAVKAGGVPLLASLVLFSALIQFVFSFRMGQFRRIVTPTVGGTVIMLIAVTAFPVCFRLINAAPMGAPADSLAGPLAAVATFVTIIAISLFSKGALRLGSPVVGVLTGCVVAALFGALDLSRVGEAAWIGLPGAGWPGLDLSFGTDFWVLLVPFMIVTIVGAIETYGDGVAIQRVSNRTPRPIDFRAVQGAVNADGLGNFLSGLAGTLPNTTYSTSISVVDLTGVGARAVAVFGGVFLLLLAFSPKLSALLQSIPDPVAGAYIMVLLILLFGHGLRLVTEDGLGFENGLVVCVSFWLAVGFQNQLIFAERLPGWARVLLDNGMTAGGMIAVALTLLIALKGPKGQRIDVPAEIRSIARVHRSLKAFASRKGWDEPAILRLELAVEEAMLFLIERGEGCAAGGRNVVRVSLRARGPAIEVEMISAPVGSNFGELIRSLDDRTPPAAADAGLRILAGLADTVRHEQFHGADYLVVTLDSRPA